MEMINKEKPTGSWGTPVRFLKVECSKLTVSFGFLLVSLGEHSRESSCGY